MSNPWTILTSIGANIIILIKAVINVFALKRIGRAKLASKRYKELLVPLSQEFNNVRVETCIAKYGRRADLLKILLLEVLKLIIGKSNFNVVSQCWMRFKNPIISKPSCELVWDEPNFESLDKILNEKRDLVNKQLSIYWYRLKESYHDVYAYCDEDKTERMIEFILYISKQTDLTRDYLEKNYPNLLVE